MSELPWWERWREVLDREIAALDAAGISWRRDEAAFANGVMRLYVTVETPAGRQEMVIVYPDDYPYFRCEVYAPGLNVPFHQNPFERNLCLLGRRTHFWNNDGTAAELITEQLPKLLSSAAENDPAAVVGIEELQAEPLGVFYPYHPSMILVQGDWNIGSEHSSGTLRIATGSSDGPVPGASLRGAVLQVRSESGQVLCSADAALRRAFPGMELEARWARVESPIRIADQGQFIQELMRRHPLLRDAKRNRVHGNYLRIWAVLFPEQVAHRVIGEGWMFACVFDANRPGVNKVARPHFRHLQKKGKKRGGK